MKIDRRLIAAAAAVLLVSGWARADDFSPWLHAYIVTLTAPTGVATDQANFPVLIRLTSSTFSPSIFSQANSDGSDIRFSKMDGTTPQPYQIERWDNANQVAEIWVKIDNVVGTTNGGQTQFKMYWGNTGATSQSNGANVFNSSNGFLGVWHLNEQGNTNFAGYADATGVYPGTGNNMVSGDQVSGQIAYGQNLGNGLLGKYIAIFGSASGTGCTVNVTAVNAGGSITGVSTTPIAGGSGYVVGDRLLVSGGDGGIVNVTSVGGGGAVTGVSFNTCSGEGTGCTLNITAAGGVVTGATIVAAGTGYFVGDTLTISGGGGNATVKVTAGNTTNGGNNAIGVGAISIVSGGTGYTTGTPIATTNNNFYTTGTKATKNLGNGINFATAPNITYSAWVWSSGTSNQDNIISMCSATGGSYIDFNRYNATSNLNLSRGANSDALHDDWTTDGSFPNPSTSWMHVGVTKTTAGVAAIYVNGVSRAITTNNAPLGAATYYYNQIGSKYYANWGQFFQGQVNEVEISNVVRSSDWMNLCYQSQQTNPTWIAFTPIATTIPTITTQPSSQSVSVGSLASFSVVASGGGLSYQWQRSNNGGTTWNSVSGGSGGTTANYSFTTVLADNSAQFRCYVSNSFGNATSNAATLTVTCTAPAIGTQPSNTSVNAGQNATFTVGATGSSLTYQWQRNTGTWTNIGGATGATYSFTTAYPADNGAQFQCVVTGACGTITSNVATLTVLCPTATITVQPTNQATSAGNNVTFSVTATGATSYQWLRSDNSGTSWYNAAGASTATTYTFATVIGDNGSWFKCNVTNACGTVASNYATLSVSPACVAPSISVQPQTDTVPSGMNATFSVTATGTGLTYQWQYSSRDRKAVEPFRITVPANYPDSIPLQPT